MDPKTLPRSYFAPTVPQNARGRLPSFADPEYAQSGAPNAPVTRHEEAGAITVRTTRRGGMNTRMLIALSIGAFVAFIAGAGLASRLASEAPSELAQTAVVEGAFANAVTVPKVEAEAPREASVETPAAGELAAVPETKEPQQAKTSKAPVRDTPAAVKTPARKHVVMAKRSSKPNHNRSSGIVSASMKYNPKTTQHAHVSKKAKGHAGAKGNIKASNVMKAYKTKSGRRSAGSRSA